MKYNISAKPCNHNCYKNVLYGSISCQISKTKIVELIFCCAVAGTPYLVQFSRNSQVINSDFSLTDETIITDQNYNHNKVSRGNILLLDYQFVGVGNSNLLQVKKYCIMEPRWIDDLQSSRSKSFSLTETPGPCLFNPGNLSDGTIFLKAEVLKKSRVKTNGDYFLLFCELSTGQGLSNFLVMVKSRGSTVQDKINLYFLSEQIDLDQPYYFSRMQCSKFKISSNQTDYTRCLLFTIGSSNLQPAISCTLDSTIHIDPHLTNLKNTYPKYFTDSDAGVESEADLVNYQGVITKVCSLGCLAYYELDHSLQFHPLHIPFTNSSSLHLSLVAGSTISIFNCHHSILSESSLIRLFPCCNTSVQIVEFAPPSHGLLPLKLSKSILNANFYDMILFNQVLERVSALLKTVQTLQETKNTEYDIWRQCGGNLCTVLSSTSTLKSLMLAFGWTELKISKLELVDHAECKAAVQRYTHLPLCTTESIKSKAFLGSSSDTSSGPVVIELANTILGLFEMLAIGVGLVRDDVGSILVYLSPPISNNDYETDDFLGFCSCSKPRLVLISKATLVVETYATTVPPLVYLTVKFADVKVIGQGPKVQALKSSGLLETFYVYITNKGGVGIGTDKEGSKYLHALMSGFVVPTGRQDTSHVYIRYTNAGLLSFHACRLHQTYKIKIPSRCYSKVSDAHIVEWDSSECQIQVAQDRIKPASLDSDVHFVSIPSIYENVFRYCTESPVIELVNLSQLKIVSKSIERVRGHSKDTRALFGGLEINSQYDTVLLLSSNDSIECFKLYVVDSLVPLFGLVPGAHVSLFGIKIEVRCGRVVGVAGVGSMIVHVIAEDPLLGLVPVSPIVKVTYLRNMFPSLQDFNIPSNTWISSFPLKIFDVTLDVTCKVCGQSRYLLCCPVCGSPCVLTGFSNVLFQDSTMEFSAAIEGAESVLKLLELDGDVEQVMSYICLCSEPFRMVGNLSIRRNESSSSSSDDEIGWLQAHLKSGAWKRRLLLHVASLPLYLVNPPMFGSETSPAVFTNPDALKVRSDRKDLSGNLYLTLGLKALKVKVCELRESDPVKEAFDILDTLSLVNP